MARSPQEIASIIGVHVHEETNFSGRLRKAARLVPAETRRALGRALSYWRGMAIKATPVAQTRRKGSPSMQLGVTGQMVYRPLESKRPRGGLRKSYQAFLAHRGDTFVAALHNAMPYSGYLEFPGEGIAGGSMANWRPGQAPATVWPHKAPGTTATIPFMRPQLPKVLTQLYSDMMHIFVETGIL